MRAALRYLTIAGLLPLFAAAVVLSMVAALLALPFPAGRAYASRVFRALNKATAAGLPFGWDGRRPVSAECGFELALQHEMSRPASCRFCRVLCAVLAFALNEPDHCPREALRVRP